MHKTYSRSRPFVGITENGKLELLTSSTKQPTKRYIVRMVGPFKTLRGARFYRQFPMCKTVNQAEVLAKETD